MGEAPLERGSAQRRGLYRNSYFYQLLLKANKILSNKDRRYTKELYHCQTDKNMSSFVIEGGHKLSGSIRPQGAKNEALEVICAVLLTHEEVVISNIPEILDVRNLILYHTEDSDLERRKRAYSTEAGKNFMGDIYVPDDIETIILNKA